MTTAPAVSLSPGEQVLRCGGCGRIGSRLSTAGHRGKSKNIRCRLTDPTPISMDEAIAAIGAAAQDRAVTEPEPELEAASPTPAPVETEAVAETQEARAVEEDDDPDDEDERPTPRRGRPPSTHRVTDKRASAAAARMETMRVRVPASGNGSTRKGGDGSPLGAPLTTIVELRLSQEVLGLFEVSRTDPNLNFTGNLSDFVNTLVPAFFASIGARGLRLVWEPPPPPPPPAPFAPAYSPAIVMGEL